MGFWKHYSDSVPFLTEFTLLLWKDLLWRSHGPILGAYSCDFRSNIPLPWNIQANKQYTYCDVTNAFITIFLLFRSIHGATFLCVEFLTCFFRCSLCDLQNRNLSQKLCLVVHSYFQSCWCYCRFTHLHCHCSLSIYPEPYLGSSQTSVVEFFCENVQRLSVGNHFRKKALS